MDCDPRSKPAASSTSGRGCSGAGAAGVGAGGGNGIVSVANLGPPFLAYSHWSLSGHWLQFGARLVQKTLPMVMSV